MPGIIYRVLPKTTFTFSGLTSPSSQLPFDFATGIDVSQYREVTMMWRIHNYTITNTPSVKLDIYAEFPTPEDPGMNSIFNAAVPTTTIPLSGLAVPYLAIAGNGMWNGSGSSFLRVRITPVQPSLPASYPFVVTMSGDMVAKS